MPSANTLPDKYYRYTWAKKIKKTDIRIGGEGENILGNNTSDSMNVSYDLLKTDINNDGWCDWIVTLSIPASTGGDRDSVNAFYLGHSKGWHRVGPKVRGADKPADFGSGPDDEFDFFETSALLYEKSEKKTYLIGVFWDRNGSQLTKPGYHIYLWDKQKNNLTELDKWKDENSAGAQAYAYFKRNGGFVGLTEHPLERFVVDNEKKELQKR